MLCTVRPSSAGVAVYVSVRNGAPLPALPSCLLHFTARGQKTQRVLGLNCCFFASSGWIVF